MSSVRYFSFYDPTEEITGAQWLAQGIELGGDDVLYDEQAYGYRFHIRWLGAVGTAGPRQTGKYVASVAKLDGTEERYRYFNDYDEAEGHLLQTRGLLLHARIVGEDNKRRALLGRLARAMQQVIDRKDEHGEGVGQEPAGGARRQAARVPKGWSEDLH